MSADLWPAPLAGGPIHAKVRVPGSKSITNRALLLAALATGPSVVRRPLIARDTRLMIAALQALGVGVAVGDEECVVTPPHALRGPATIDVGNAGTVMRFLPPVAALAEGTVRFTGDARASDRPLAELLDALRALGVHTDGARSIPFELRGTGRVTGGAVGLDASASSQFVSALLLAGARFDEGVTVTNTGARVPSLPHIEMTLAMLAAQGVPVVASGVDRWSVEPHAIAPLDLTVEPDLSNAGPFMCAAVVTGGEVTILDWPLVTTQPGDAFCALLSEMGARCDRQGNALTVTRRGELRGLTADLHDHGELAPTIAALCALATTPSRLTGIAHLRGHETDRLAALAHELTALGANVRELPDGLEIDPAPLHGGTFHTYDDHRLATAAALIGLVTPGVQVENIATVGKTLPEFTDRWKQMLDGR